MITLVLAAFFAKCVPVALCPTTAEILAAAKEMDKIETFGIAYALDDGSGTLHMHFDKVERVRSVSCGNVSTEVPPTLDCKLTLIYKWGKSKRRVVRMIRDQEGWTMSGRD
jgi:hypothetical protein